MGMFKRIFKMITMDKPNIGKGNTTRLEASTPIISRSNKNVSKYLNNVETAKNLIIYISNCKISLSRKIFLGVDNSFH